MNQPKNTYRIQFHKNFTFADFNKIRDYLHQLGVNTIYASPIFEAVAGSVHGYDVTNPSIINPEIGSLTELREISNWLKEREMQWLQDIVPNHMAFHPQNKLLMDVLEKGAKSKYKNYFDTCFSCPMMEGKLMVPFLGEALMTAIDENKIALFWDGSRLNLRYADQKYPVSPASYSFILNHLKEDQLIAEVEKLENINDAASYSAVWETLLVQIGHLFNNSQNQALLFVLEAVNQQNSFLKEIVNLQHYELCFWQESNERMNYRRFFTVNGLICLNMQHQEVFDTHHQFIAELLKEDLIQGLRIDHIDGLFEPSTYLQRLRDLAGKDTYIIAEKILAKEEELPAQWPIEGNTGYDFLAMVNNVLTYPNDAVLKTFYQSLINDDSNEAQQIIAKKSHILATQLQGEADNLTLLFNKLRLSKDKVKPAPLKKAIAALLIHIPIYRFYSENYPLLPDEKRAVEEVFKNIRQEDIDFEDELNILENVFLGSESDQAVQQAAKAVFFKRCMQFSGPLMAKGVEDTLMYTYYNLIVHNEVGDEPFSEGISIADFHELMMKRAKRSPLSLNATATHDTKMGEDARARLQVISSMPNEWLQKVQYWQNLNQKKRLELSIARHEEYFIYQNLIAHYPMPGINSSDFEERLNNYLQKAFREGKLLSDWANPNQQYEENIKSFVHYLLNDAPDFQDSFFDYLESIAQYGAFQALTQLTLKFTCPGIPDVYQGNELWDFDFVDPDNRRSVVYEERSEFLKELDADSSIENLITDFEDGKIKIYLTHHLTQLRNSEALLFNKGSYEPIKVKGKYKDHILAFSRTLAQKKIVIVCVIGAAKLMSEQGKEFFKLNWEDTALDLGGQAKWFNTIQRNQGEGNLIQIKDLDLLLPVAVLKIESQKDFRNAGVFMHISSLPSKFGVGDLGTAAYEFADFLKSAKQRYWQICPIGPNGLGDNYSPYSTVSTMAGNPLFISPELLQRQGLLSDHDLEDLPDITDDYVNYPEAAAIKYQLLDQAWRNYQKQGLNDTEFNDYCEKEKDWLLDYALFTVLNELYHKEWWNWPLSIKLRQQDALKEIINQNKDAILKQQWFQYLFFQQWHQLKSYCNQNYIHIIGDLPFYVSHHSADVWANQSIFKLNEDGSIKGIAGVPPDYFSKDGQLWGMPVYEWEELRDQKYNWWLGRLKQQLNFFDLLRLDHFRAFYDFWEVPQGAENAISGEWQLGPGAAFFEKLKSEFPTMPFIAEDLGEISPGVFDLRDEFQLAGMKVLQFAFDEEMCYSAHIPHQHERNFLVYTGTHDNNTTKGWFKNDLDASGKNRLSSYLQQNPNESNIAEMMIRLAYASVAKTAIIPIQDLLNLGEEYRFNRPGTTNGNWSFRLNKKLLNVGMKAFLNDIIKIYGRG